MPPGFILHDEFRIMQENGMSALEVLRSATVNAANAMRREAEFGAISPGKRADLVLLSANPLLGSANLSSIAAVVVRGIVLDATDIRDISDRVRAIYDPRPVPAVESAATEKGITEMVVRMERLRLHHFVFRAQLLARLAQLLTTEGLADEARRVSLLQDQ
jgi:adenine deaminase